MRIETASWPEDLTPERSSVHVRNELRIDAPVAAVWDVLVDAAAWPAWYRHCKDVRIDGGARRLTPGATFRWRTNGQPLRSAVQAFEVGREVAWDASNPLIRVYHLWRLEPTERGCHVVTEETQRGLLPWTTRPITQRVMLRVHREWLEALAARAAGRTGR